ncbi:MULTISPECIES: DUF2332 domain-containing protein [Actinosynnema]|uniref:DUF2332 family protein n=1 Tax=Actinosynnema TaxID=40566 RepID=UPI0020A416DF|nr:DUF2332 domain-containing protein [Actinosynnema pretiosum]MCP2097409.1 hypothetical protein [Actinosynnema pretiosum]
MHHPPAPAAHPADRDPDALAWDFRHLSVRAEVEGSPLHAVLARTVAASPSLLRLAATAPAGQWAPQMLLAAVHLLLRGPYRDDPLARVHDGRTRPADRLGDAAGHFARFCGEHGEEITATMTGRRAQTNDPLRAAALLPALAEIAARTTGRLHLIDVGSGAGLHLLWPHYHYRYRREGLVLGEHLPSGAADGPLLVCDLRGELPPLEVDLDRFAAPIGIDRDPVDLTDPDTLAWTQALSWPEHGRQRELLEQVVPLARRHRCLPDRADAVAVLPDLIADVPEDGVPVLLMSWSLLQVYGDPRDTSPGSYAAARTRFAEVLRHAGRRVLVIGIDHVHEPDVRIHVHHGGLVRGRKAALTSLRTSPLRWVPGREGQSPWN